AGAGWAMFVIAMAFAAATGSWALAIVAAVIGFVLVLSMCIVGVRLATGLRGTMDRLATRAKNLEVRVDSVACNVESLEQELGEIGARAGGAEEGFGAMEKGLVETFDARFITGGEEIAALRRSVESVRSAQESSTERLEAVRKDVRV